MSKEEWNEFEEEEEEEADPFFTEDRRKRLSKKLDDFMADITIDMMPPEMIKKIEKKILSTIKKEGLDATTKSFLAFAAGFEWGVTAYMNLEHNVAPIVATLKKMKKEQQRNKPKIDITKSIPMEDTEHGGE